VRTKATTTLTPRFTSIRPVLVARVHITPTPAANARTGRSLLAMEG